MYKLESFLMVSSPSSSCNGNLICVGTEESNDNRSLSLSPPTQSSGNIPAINVPTYIGSREISLLNIPNISGRDDWKCIYDMFKTDPSKLTPAFLTMTLKRRPSTSLVKSMLKINPDAASIPKLGPSALHVAVQRNCSIAVIKELIKACPFALIATNPGTKDDPLSYAKRFRGEELELIELLSLPVHHWLSTKNAPGNDEPNSTKYSYGPVSLPKIGHTSSLCPAESTDVLAYSTDVLIKANCNNDSLNAIEEIQLCSSIDAKELKNLELICLTILKKHKLLWNQVQLLQKEYLDVPPKSITEQANSIQDVRLHELQLRIDRQDHDFQLAIEKIELQTHKKVVYLQERINEVLHHFEVNFENAFESRMNTITSCFHFRLQHLTQRVDRMESQLQNALTNSNQGNDLLRGGRANVHCNRHHNTDNHTIDTVTASTFGDTTPIVFATPWHHSDDDDVRSLLTDDILLHRRRKWHPWASGKRLFSILFRV